MENVPITLESVDAGEPIAILSLDFAVGMNDMKCHPLDKLPDEYTTPSTYVEETPDVVSESVELSEILIAVDATKAPGRAT